MDATLDGYAWLPRMIDKSRAARAGTLGDGVHPCPVDRRCLALLGIGFETFSDVVARSADDAAVLAGLRAAGIASAAAAWFDAPAWEDALAEMVWRSDGETISDRDARNIIILHTEEAVTVTWSRYSSGSAGRSRTSPRAHRCVLRAERRAAVRAGSGRRAGRAGDGGDVGVSAGGCRAQLHERRGRRRNVAEHPHARRWLRRVPTRRT